LPTSRPFWTTSLIAPRRELRAFILEFALLPICSCGIRWLGAVTDDPAIRRLTTTPYPYLIFYEAADDEVVIHAVRHGARDPSDNPRSE
jgi:ParE toxin of type II toxin-antitoxin system, parDE